MRRALQKNVSWLLIFVMVLSLGLTACGTKKAETTAAEETVKTTVAETAAETMAETTKESVEIGIAWRADLDSEFYTNICTAVEEAGATPVLLGQVISADVVYEDGAIITDYIDENDVLKLEYAEKIRENTYKDSNVKEVLGDLDAVIFTGGEDIAPTLYATPEDWHGIEEEKDYNATRDVSDYLLMSYCLDNDIAVMGFCRGMQMLSVVSGATAMQDIPTYFAEEGKEYNYEHRNQKVGDEYRDYAPHNVEVAEDSLLYKITGTTTLENVPSWHHQAIMSVEGTDLTVTGTTTVSDVDMIEAVERTDKTFVIGLQFHPEAAIVKNLKNADNKDDFISYDDAMKFFYALVEAAA